ncbi:MAG: hypothetical protein BGO21_05675 [Dyadobacter sp. 50-39]|uniref:hypothetical protein n=1 Tax=Dyadobacter sp. 50-39 TaxID=1895756 RepID=UPI000965DB63|nr:hypothetical protein [Dyadobacter sp. 50-39]OJV22644.1 MAG: hypothetical protein BGO21_05675 [Dyadobacter sp. 50-39]
MSKGLFIILIVSLVICYGQIRAQSAKQSDYILKYNMSTYHLEDGKSIPFDHAFSLKVPALSGKKTKKVKAYESAVKGAKRERVKTKFLDCDGTERYLPIMDKELSYDRDSDTLIIHVDALRPNKYFDILVEYELGEKSKPLLAKTNKLIAGGKLSDAQQAYNVFWNSTFDPVENIGVNDWSYSEYKTFYDASLAPSFNSALDKTNYDFPDVFDQDELRVLTALSGRLAHLYKNASLLMPVIVNDKAEDVLLGIQSIGQLHAKPEDAEMLDFEARHANLLSSKLFLDSLLLSIDRILLVEGDSPIVDGTVVQLNDLRKKGQKLLDAAQKNAGVLKAAMKEIDKQISNQPKLRSMIAISGNTVASDLKTAGGSVLFLDAGLTNILARDIQNNTAYIPRLYWGVSIYFRPIDKNTRTNSFYRKKDLDINKGCRKRKDGSTEYGPDYEIISKQSIMQRLSLNIGFTLGGIPQTEFDNLYNNMSLLVGPSIRFARAFKLSGGVSLLKRSSYNPMYSEKKVVAGAYASLSVDIDFIQGLKEVTALIFK